MLRGSWPISAGPSSRSTMVTREAQSPALPTAAFASPNPSAPSSVRTVTSTASKVRSRPKSDVCCFSSGMGARSQRASTAAIFKVQGLPGGSSAARSQPSEA